MPKEIETKFMVVAPEEIRAKLGRIGARFLSKEIEKDVYYSGPAKADVTSVRLRSAGPKGLFTIKSLPETEGAAAPGMKVLDEQQVGVEDPDKFGRMLETMGYAPQFRKEKVRESYDWRGILICLDELPHLGFFLEVEAPEAGIRAAAFALGLDMSQAIGETYMQIFARYKVGRNVPDLELVFG